MEKQKARQAVAFVLPSLIGMSLFFGGPFLISVYYAFTEKLDRRKIVGFTHFKEVLENEAFRKAAMNTFCIVGSSVVVLAAGSLIVAAFLETQFKKRHYMGGILLIPMAIPTSSLLLFWQDLLGEKGIVGSLIGVKVDLLSSRTAMIIAIGMIVWKYIGYHVLIVLSSLMVMPKAFEEAASMDGAGKWRILWSIKLPYLMPIMFFNTVMASMNSFKIYREIYLLQGEYPYEGLYMIQHFMNNYFVKLELEKLSAAALMLYMVLFLLIKGMSILQQRLLNEEGR